MSHQYFSYITDGRLELYFILILKYFLDHLPGQGDEIYDMWQPLHLDQDHINSCKICLLQIERVREHLGNIYK